MKKLFLLLLTFIAMAAEAQTKGSFEILDLGSFKLHAYNTNDVLGDASYIIEGSDGLVTLEQPLFKDNVSEFDAYVTSLNKPVRKIVTNYHVGGTGSHDIVMIEGMPDFVQGAVYGGMMQNFAKIFGDAIVSTPTGKAEEVSFGSNQNWCGVTFVFQKGASTDFPAASIIIGDKVYYTHWTPAKSHISHLQVSSLAAIDAEIAEAGKALNSGCKYFIGGHGGKLARILTILAGIMPVGGIVVFNSVSEESLNLFRQEAVRSGFRLTDECRIAVDDHNPITVLKACAEA